MHLDQPKTMGTRLRRIRVIKDLTQENIAVVLNTYQTVYARYERDERLLPTNHLRTLCQFYDVSADYLLGLIDEPLSYERNEK